jgi:hypothetical protein
MQCERDQVRTRKLTIILDIGEGGMNTNNLFIQTTLLLLLILAFSKVALARTIQIRDDQLQIEMTVSGSVAARPIVSIVDKQSGIDIKGIMDGVNMIISNSVKHCHPAGPSGILGIAGIIDYFTNCQYIGFEPMRAKIMPYNQILLGTGAPNTPGLALVLHGRVLDAQDGQVMTYYIPIQYLLELYRRGQRLNWHSNQAGIYTSLQAPFSRVKIEELP